MTRPTPGLAKVLNRLSLKTLEWSGSQLVSAASSSEELPGWLSRKLFEAEAQQSVSGTGQIQLATIDLAPAYWIRIGNAQEFVVRLLDLLDIPRLAFVREDVVRFYKFPPTFRGSSLKSPEPVLVKSVGCLTSGIAWKYYPKSATTIGIAWFQDREGREEINYIVERMTKLWHFFFYPSLLALLALQAIAISMRRWLVIEQRRVEDAQIKSGYHRYAGEEIGKHPKDIDFGKLSASVSGLSANIVTSEVCLKGLQDLALSIIQENEAFGEDKSFLDKALVEQATHYFGLEARYWAAECGFLLQDAVAWQRKAGIVIQGIFNLIAQRDQNTSISIARDSKILAEQSQRIAHESRILAEETKRDSTSMKAIAAITSFFLPGTFVAAFFSMPLFQWNDTPSSIANPYLWIYWAITVPLTILVISAWMIWDRLSSRSNPTVAKYPNDCKIG